MADHEGIRTWLVLGLFGAAITASAAPPEKGTPIPITRASGAIVVDGDLSDPGWQGATKVTAWYETNPGDNTEPKFKNVGYLTYDDKFLYAGFEFSDDEPGKIRAPYGDRDNVSSTTDYGGIILDTQGDARRAILFLANPHGIQYDANTDDASGEDSSPDYFWDSAARITPQGWVLELRIPFSSLRYEKADSPNWNIMLYRNHPRDFRSVLLDETPPRRQLFHLPLESAHRPDRPAVGWTPRRRAVRDREPGRVPQGRARLPARERVGQGGRGVGHQVDPQRQHGHRRDPQSGLLADRVRRRADRRERAVRALLPGEATVLPGRDRALRHSHPGRLHAHDHVSPLGCARDREDRTHGLNRSRRGRPRRRERHPPRPQFLGPRRPGVPLDRGRRAHPSRSRAVLRQLPRDRSRDPRQRRRRVQPRFRPGLPLEPLGEGHDHRATPVLEQPGAATQDLASEWNGQKLSDHAGQIWWSHSTRTFDFFTHGDEFRADNGFVPQVGFRENYSEAGWTFRPTGAVRRLRIYLIADYQAQQDGALIFRQVSPGFGMDAFLNSFVRLRVGFDKVRAGRRRSTARS